MKVNKLAEYFDVLHFLIFQKKITSLFRVSILSLVIINDCIVIPGNSKNYLVDKFFERLQLILKENFDDFKYIFEVLKLLEKEYISVVDNVIKIAKCSDNVYYNKKMRGVFMKNLFEDLELIQEKTFVHKVLENV